MTFQLNLRSLSWLRRRHSMRFLRWSSGLGHAFWLFISRSSALAPLSIMNLIARELTGQMLLDPSVFYDFHAPCIYNHLYIFIVERSCFGCLRDYLCLLDELRLRCQTVSINRRRGTPISIGQQVLRLSPCIILCRPSAMLLWRVLRILIFSLHGDASTMWPFIIRFLSDSPFIAHFDIWWLLLFIGCNWTHIDRWLNLGLLRFLMTLLILFHSIFGSDAYLGQRVHRTLLRSIQLGAVLVGSIIHLKLREIRIGWCFLIKQLGMEFLIFGIPACCVPLVHGKLFGRQMKRRMSQMRRQCILTWLIKFIMGLVGFERLASFGCWKWMNWSNRLQNWSSFDYAWFIYLIQVDTSITLHQGRSVLHSEEMCTCTIAYCFAVLLDKRFTSCDGLVWAF